MNKKLLIGGLIIFIVVVYLFWSGMKDSSVYFLTVDEFFAQAHQLEGKGTRINGEVVPGSIQWDAPRLLLSFQLTDGNKVLNVQHKGVAPDTFQEGLSVVVEGKYENGTFNATQIMTKCPSKYEAKRE
ncbi:MAG: cytochrome c maturation protein CcmE [candidate division KSB1 bacterium]|nr:cytochrome c maturation protein CcmE [candidate division KSB1 bacterium]MDZ7356139.1 cytochrome c maturation protein CcmE [candidate division KSB1 bacterium]